MSRELEPVIVPYPDYFDCAYFTTDSWLEKNFKRAMAVLRARVEGDDQSEAVKPWIGHEHSLVELAQDMLSELTDRAYRMSFKIEETEYPLELGRLYFRYAPTPNNQPDWTKDENVLESHQSYLIREDQYAFGEFFEGVSNQLPLRLM